MVDTIVSIIVTIIASGLIAAYFRLGVKPKIEIVFEKNRLANFMFVFNEIQEFDSQVEVFYVVLEREFGPVTPARKMLFSESATIDLSHGDETISGERTFREFRHLINESGLKQTYTNLENCYKKYLNGEQTYQIYIESELLHSVERYYWITLHWMNHILNGNNLPILWESRLKHAMSIIDYIESDPKIKMIQSASGFVTKWRKYIGDYA